MDRPVDPDEVQALARESSIVCRQNAKLRAQLAELQAAREQDSSAFRSAMEDRPSSNDLQAARASLAKSEACVSDLEQALAVSEETVSTLQSRIAMLESERGSIASDAATNEKIHREAERE